MNALRRHSMLTSVVLLFVLLTVAYTASIDLRATRGASITGDEPFYLLTTQSLIADHDLDLRNQYEWQTYRSFFDHAQPLWSQSGIRPGAPILSPHEPALSVYLVPGFVIAGLRGAQVQLLLTAALTFALMYVLVASEGVQPLFAWLATATVALTATPFVYATEVYPELPAALCLVVGALLLRGHSPSWARSVAVALACTALVWLGTKYALAIVLAAACLLRADLRGRLALLGIGAAAALSYAAWHLATYGSLTAYSASWAFEGAGTVEVVRDHLALPDRAYRLVGLFVDVNFGLVRWAPVLGAAVAALPVLLRRGTGQLVVALFAAQMALAVFVAITMMGWWFPGRTMVTVLPFMAWPLAEVLARASRWGRVGVAALAAWSFAISGALVAASHAGEVVIAVDPFLMRSPLFSGVAVLFPDYRAWDTHTIVFHAFWSVALVAALAASCWSERDAPWCRALLGIARRVFSSVHAMRRGVRRTPRPVVE